MMDIKLIPIKVAEIATFAFITLKGGRALASVIFPGVAVGEEITACCILVGILTGFICHVFSRHMAEAAAARMAAYTARRDAKFAEAEAQAFMIRYELMRADFLEGRNAL